MILIFSTGNGDLQVPLKSVEISSVNAAQRPFFFLVWNLLSCSDVVQSIVN